MSMFRTFSDRAAMERSWWDEVTSHAKAGISDWWVSANSTLIIVINVTRCNSQNKIKFIFLETLLQAHWFSLILKDGRL